MSSVDLRHTDPSADARRAAHSSAGAGHVEGGFHHETLFYSREDEFVAGTLPFIDDALANDEPVLVAVGNAKIELLKEALGRSADRVRFVDMRVLGHNPARIIPAWQQFLQDNARDGRSVRAIGEPVWPGRSQAELEECQLHESLLNVAFGEGQTWHLLCPYDLDGLDESVIAAARRSHPFIAQDGDSRASEAYARACSASGPFDGTLPPPATHAQELAFTCAELGMLRRVVSEWASRSGLGAERTQRLVLATNELASNSVRHGGGSGTLLLWQEEDTLLVEVRDRGRIREALVGRIRPAAARPMGRGLWLANHLCDLVQIRSASKGSVVRLHMHAG
jgi:anti-sigma regulatory factor (Ser/Thr protein kinase)